MNRRAVFFVHVKTTNPVNGGTGNTRLAGIMRSRQRAKQRETVTVTCHSLRHPPSRPAPPWRITLTRIAPSSGLDDDSLPVSMKAIRDELAKLLGVENDRDPVFTWVYAQERGRPGEYLVRVAIETGGKT